MDAELGRHCTVETEISVLPSFLTGAPFDIAAAAENRRGSFGWDQQSVNPPRINSTPAILDVQRRGATAFEYKTITECYKLYEDYWAAQGNVLVVVTNSSSRDEVPLRRICVSRPRMILKGSGGGGLDAPFLGSESTDTSHGGGSLQPGCVAGSS